MTQETNNTQQATPAEYFIRCDGCVKECIRDNMYGSLYHWAHECYMCLRLLNAEIDRGT